MLAELLTRPDGGAPAFCDLRGRIQADIVAGLPGHFRRMAMAPDQLHDWQRDRLRRLLASAIQRSAFHARRLHGIDPSRFELADLPSLPVMTKAQMMDHFDDLISGRLLTREAAERVLAATHDEPRPLPGGYTCMATGGSSGQRGIFAFDPVSVAEFVSLIFRTRLAALGLASTDRPVQLPRVTFAMVGAASAVHGTVFVPSVLAGSPVRFVSAPVSLPVSEIVGRLNEVQADGLFGYPSMLARLAAEQHAGRLRIAPRLVNCTAETLQPEFRAAIKKAFGAPVFNTFASTEGLIGSSGPDDPAIALATDSCIVELVDAANRPVPPGTPSAKVLVTNLFNDLESETSVAGLREQLGAALARAGLPNPEVTVDAVAALPRNPETGKLRRVIPA